MTKETPVLSLRGMNKQFGEGCARCLDQPENLEKNYCPACGTVYACRGISFDLYKGEIIGIVSEAAPKSTLMNPLFSVAK
jgi:putative phosphonate transport system ATP-binding protein